MGHLIQGLSISTLHIYLNCMTANLFPPDFHLHGGEPWAHAIQNSNSFIYFIFMK